MKAVFRRLRLPQRAISYVDLLNALFKCEPSPVNTKVEEVKIEIVKQMNYSKKHSAKPSLANLEIAHSYQLSPRLPEEFKSMTRQSSSRYAAMRSGKENKRDGGTTERLRKQMEEPSPVRSHAMMPPHTDFDRKQHILTLQLAEQTPREHEELIDPRVMPPRE